MSGYIKWQILGVNLFFNALYKAATANIRKNMCSKNKAKLRNSYIMSDFLNIWRKSQIKNRSLQDRS